MKKIELIEKFSSSRVLVVGDLILDRYVWGEVSRISPEAPVPVVRVKKRSDTLGGGGNTAQAIAALGAAVTVAGRLGQDLAGGRIKELFNQRDVEFFPLHNGELPTTVKSRIIAESQHVVRVDEEVRRPLELKMLLKKESEIKKMLTAHDALLLSDYGKGIFSSETLSFWLKLSRQTNTPVVVDPHIEHFPFYKTATLITPNEREMREGMKRVESEDHSLDKLAAKAIKKLNLAAVLVTQGERGMTLFEEKNSPYHIDTEAREVYDVTGAGDTVAAVVALGEALAEDRRRVIELANIAAGLVVAQMGTTAITAEQLKQELEK
ncbi:MAG: bifunctional heptose 7-phosphate kinase/heptose 1-phosphate adenyltransferase [bacterium]